jgi:hypothetical protein
MAGYGYDYSCSRCDTEWRDIRYAHCGGCHRTFGGVTGFDHHRAHGGCSDPDPVQYSKRDDGVFVGRFELRRKS